MDKADQQLLRRSYPYILIVGGAIGLFSSIMLTIEKIHLLENPGAELACDINPIIGCSSVISTDQASAFGFSNPFLGIAGFAVLITVGMAILAGAGFKRWFWLGLQAGATLGAIFVHWLIYVSIYELGSLCPYCMVVWTITMPIFWYTTLQNFRQGHLKVNKRGRKLVNFAQTNHATILLAWYLIVIGLILNQFWYYWSTLV